MYVKLYGLIYIMYVELYGLFYLGFGWELGFFWYSGCVGIGVMSVLGEGVLVYVVAIFRG